MKQKHVADVIVLVCSIQNKMLLPRTILRNGKRSVEEFRESQARTQITAVPPDVNNLLIANPVRDQGPLQPADAQINSPSQRLTAEDSIFRSTVAMDIGLLKLDMDNLKSELQQLKCKLPCESNNSDLDTCMLYIRFKKPVNSEINQILLESRLDLKILDYYLIRSRPTPAFRVKIHKSALHHALTHARENSCVADIWRSAKSKWKSYGTTRPNSICNSRRHPEPLKITSWNCRGLTSAIPYINNLMEEGSMS